MGLEVAGGSSLFSSRQGDQKTCVHASVCMSVSMYKRAAGQTSSMSGEVWKYCYWLALALDSNCRLLCLRGLDLEYDSKMRVESDP